MTTFEVNRVNQSHKVVAGCYSVVDRFLPKCGVFDLTEGMYFGRPETSFAQAQANQRDYLLEQVECQSDSRLLDVGCGYGTLLARAQERGAKAIGITLSPEQVRHCRRAGLNAYLLDYKAMGPEWNQAFDGVVANGSAEHFVQPADALAGKADEIYRHFFRTIHRAIHPESPGRLVTTVIHFVRAPHPAVLLRRPFMFPRSSDAFHYAMLARSFGGWYPLRGQLEQCARGYFKLINEVDGTDDYRRTSEEWLRRVRQSLRSWSGARIATGVFPILLTHPLQLASLLFCTVVSESWNWQFRSEHPPTRLLRQTWQYVG